MSRCSVDDERSTTDVSGLSAVEALLTPFSRGLSKPFESVLVRLAGASVGGETQEAAPYLAAPDAVRVTLDELQRPLPHIFAQSTILREPFTQSRDFVGISLPRCLLTIRGRPHLRVISLDTTTELRSRLGSQNVARKV